MLRAFVVITAVALLATWPAGARADRALSQVSLQERVDSAAPGATLNVDGGTYHETIVIDKPLSLAGTGLPVIDGDGRGDVVTITADNVSLSGFEIRGSGTAVSREPAAVKVENAHGVTLRANRIRDSHFGIHVTASHHATIAFNDIDAGSNTPIERRGHGIYLWEAGDSVIHGNTIRHAADGIHLEFSDGNGIGQNVVEESRYALHLMYSNNNKTLSNQFRHNLAGLVFMFSRDLLVKDNEIASNRRGATGAGLLLKDVDNIFVEGNTVVRNKYGLTAEGTPQAPGSTAVFLRNLFALNDTGLGLMSNAPITFVENSMVENTVQVKALGGDLGGEVLPGHGAAAPAPVQADTGGHAGHPANGATIDGAQAQAGALPETAAWTVGGRGNYWSDYRGYDANGDGVGDRPYRPEPAFAGGLTDNDTLRLFQFTLGQQAIDAAAKMFPLFRYGSVIEDSGPLMSPVGPAIPDERGVNTSLIVVSGLLLLLAAAILQSFLGLDPLVHAQRLAGRLTAGAGSDAAG